jgi:hypothetical protein
VKEKNVPFGQLRESLLVATSQRAEVKIQQSLTFYSPNLFLLTFILITIGRISRNEFIENATERTRRFRK